jgi:two-component system, cell cycle sensor histidine kinase and response regulator CckA
MQKELEKYRLMLESSKDYLLFLYKLKPVKKFEYVSPSSLIISGYSPDEHYNNPDLFLKIVFQDDFPIYEFQRNFPQLIKNPIVMRWIRKDGKIIWTEQRFTNIYDGSNIIAFVGIVKDITEQKETEFALRESEEKYRELIKNANDFIFLFGYDENLSAWKSRDMNLMAKNKFTSNNDIEIKDILSRESFIFLENRINELVEKKSLNFESVFLSQNKENVLVDVNASIFKLKGKKVVLIIARDITEKRKIEEELHKRQKLDSLALLSGGIAHDFNNLLTAILGNISLAHFNNSQEEIFKRLEDVENIIGKAKNLTQQLLTFTKYDNSIKKTGSIGKLLMDIANFIVTGTNCRCEFNIDAGLESIEYDESQIIQVINNLTLNAIQSMENGGIVSIYAGNIDMQKNKLIPDGRYILIKFIDHGIGISKDELNKIFDPFYTTKPKGSGLGLTTTYSIIKKHRGYIYAESEPEKGTVFFIYLPVSKKKVLVENDKNDKIINRGHGKILLMDDNADIRTLAKKMIEELGYDIETSKNGEETVEKYKSAIKNKPFDLVILDLTIQGGMGGKETIIELLKIDKNVKAIVTSGYSVDSVINKYEEYGFCDILNKPYSIESISKIISKHLNKIEFDKN